MTKFYRPAVFPVYQDIPKIQASNAVFSYASNAVVRNSHAKHSIMTNNKGNFAREELKMFHSLNHSNLSFIPFSSVFTTFFFLYIDKIFIWGIKYYSFICTSVLCLVLTITYVKALKKIKVYLGTIRKFFLKTKLSNLRFFQKINQNRW